MKNFLTIQIASFRKIKGDTLLNLYNHIIIISHKHPNDLFRNYSEPKERWLRRITHTIDVGDKN